MKEFAVKIIKNEKCKIDVMVGNNAVECEKYWKKRGGEKVRANRIWNNEDLKHICENAKVEYREVILTATTSMRMI